MTKLHLISQVSNLTSIKNNIARYAIDKDPLLFIGDAVLCLLDKDITAYLKQLNLPLYALVDDCRCRGISEHLNSLLKQVSSQQMVELTIKNQQVISW